MRICLKLIQMKCDFAHIVAQNWMKVQSFVKVAEKRLYKCSTPNKRTTIKTIFQTRNRATRRKHKEKPFMMESYISVLIVELLKAFTTVCPTCSYELRSVKTNSPVEALAKKLEQTSNLDEKIELITNFYIPNTKEDIYDFFILAVSNLEDKWYDTDDAWRAKLEQAYHKARLSLGNTPEFDYLEKLYNRTSKEVTKRENSIAAIFRRNKIASITALLIGGGILMLVIGIILFSATSAEENFGASWGGLMFAIIGINFLIAPTWVLEEIKKKENKNKKKNAVQKQNRSVLPIGKDAEDFYQENYDDMAEYLRSKGFKNVVTKAEKKGLLDTEGAIKAISVA